VGHSDVGEKNHLVHRGRRLQIIKDDKKTVELTHSQGGENKAVEVLRTFNERAVGIKK
jgi:hypothetical protein